MVNAVVLAGDGKKIVIDDKPVDKSYLKIHGKIMVEYVIDVLIESELVDKIAVVGSREQLLQYNIDKKVDYIADDQGSMIDNAKVGIQQFKASSRILIITSDIPLITAQAIDDFIKKACKSGAHFCYPIVNKRLNDEKYPQVKRTYVKLKEGTFTGGNLILIDPAIIDRCEHMARKLIAYRKKPWKIAQMIGIKFLIQLLAGTLTIPGLEKRFSRIMGVQAVAIISDYPEIGNDVDKVSDLEMAAQYIINRNKNFTV